MAEILLSLTIIGVVAAITLPSLTGNINERTWNTQRKALYARMSQAISLMPSLNGYGTLIEGNDSISAVDTAAETFVTAGLSKVLKINNICDNDHLSDCGIMSTFNDRFANNKSIPTTLYELNGIFSNSSVSIKNTKAVAFETQNGESIVVFYNPYCQADSGTERTKVSLFMCVNFIYDLNGKKGPNMYAKDIGFITAMYPTDSVVVAPFVPAERTTQYKSTTFGNFYEASRKCHNVDIDYRVPSIEELSAMIYNDKLLDLERTNWTWSSTNGYQVAIMTGDRWVGNKSYNSNMIQCVKR